MTPALGAGVVLAFLLLAAAVAALTQRPHGRHRQEEK